MRLENKAGSGGLCFLANLIVLAAVPIADKVTTCRVCSGTSTGVRNGLLAHLQPCAVEGQSGLASLLTTTAATSLTAATEGSTQGASTVASAATIGGKAATGATGSNEAATVKAAVGSPPEQNDRESASLGLFSTSEHVNSTDPAVSRGDETLELAPEYHTPSPDVSQLEVSRDCVATGPSPLAVAEEAPVASMIAAPTAASTQSAEKVGEQTTLTVAAGALASPERNLTCKTSTSSSTPAPLEVVADVPCPIAGTPCPPGGVDSREPLLSVEAAAPTTPLSSLLAGPQGVEVAPLVSSGLVVSPSASCAAPGKAAPPAAVFARDNADSIATVRGAKSALPAAAAQSTFTTTGGAAAPAPSLVSAKAPSLSPPVGASGSAVGASSGPPLGADNSAVNASAKPLETAGDGLPLRGGQQPARGGGASLPAHEVSPPLGGVCSSAAEASAKPLGTAGGDGLPVRGDQQPAVGEALFSCRQPVGGGALLPARGGVLPPAAAAATAARTQLRDAVAPSGLVGEREKASLELNHGPTAVTVAETCVPAKTALTPAKNWLTTAKNAATTAQNAPTTAETAATTPTSPLSTLARMAMVGFRTPQPRRGEGVSVDRKVDEATEGEAAMVAPIDVVGGVAYSVLQDGYIETVAAGETGEAGETVGAGRGPTLAALQRALNLLSDAVKTCAFAGKKFEGLQSIFRDLSDAVTTAAHTRSVDASSLEVFLVDFDNLSRGLQAAITAQGDRGCSGGTRVECVVGEGGTEESAALGGGGGGGGGDRGSGDDAGATSTPREFKFVKIVLCCSKLLS